MTSASVLFNGHVVISIVLSARDSLNGDSPVSCYFVAHQPHYRLASGFGINLFIYIAL